MEKSGMARDAHQFMIEVPINLVLQRLNFQVKNLTNFTRNSSPVRNLEEK